MTILELVKFNETILESINISGAGGKEGIIQSSFNIESLHVERYNHSIYDFIMTDKKTNVSFKIEAKKQSGVNWFDYAKYHGLSSEDEDIIMMFFLHLNGSIKTIFGNLLIIHIFI